MEHVAHDATMLTDATARGGFYLVGSEPQLRHSHVKDTTISVIDKFL